MKKAFYTKEDIMKMLKTSERRAKQIIRNLNNELNEKGYLSYKKVVNAKYFNERFNLE